MEKQLVKDLKKAQKFQRIQKKPEHRDIRANIGNELSNEFDKKKHAIEIGFHLTKSNSISNAVAMSNAKKNALHFDGIFQRCSFFSVIFDRFSFWSFSVAFSELRILT